MRFFTEFFKSKVSAIFLEFLVSQSHRVRRKYEISEDNGRLYSQIVRNLKFLRFFFLILNCLFCNFRRKSRIFWNLKNLPEFLRKLKNENFYMYFNCLFCHRMIDYSLIFRTWAEICLEKQISMQKS